MDTEFQPTLCWTCGYLSVLGLKLIRVTERGPLVVPAVERRPAIFKVPTRMLHVRVSKTTTKMPMYKDLTCQKEN